MMSAARSSVVTTTTRTAMSMRASLGTAPPPPPPGPPPPPPAGGGGARTYHMPPCAGKRAGATGARSARGGERGQRAAEARHGDLAQEDTDDRQLQQEAVDHALALVGLVIAAHRVDGAADHDSDQPPEVGDEVRQRDDDLGRHRQLGAQ